jgi:hypothetical protein
LSGQCTPVLCELTGTAGSTIGCELHLARHIQGADPAVIVNFALAYNPLLINPTGVAVCSPLPSNPVTQCAGQAADYCETTFGAAFVCDAGTGRCAECTVKTLVDPDLELKTGHTLKTCESDGGTCEAGQLNLLAFSTSAIPVTNAYVDGAGLIVGDSAFLDVQFEVLTSGTAEVSVHPGADFDASNAAAETLPLSVEHGPNPNPAHWIISNSP